MTKKKLYRVLFRQGEETYEIRARNVYQGNLHGFVEVENILYDERTKLINPAAEKIRSEFKSVQRSYIPHFNIIRIDEIDEVDKEQEDYLVHDNRHLVIYPRDNPNNPDNPKKDKK